MTALASFIVVHAKRILAVTGLLSLAAVSMLTRMEFNGDVAAFIAEGNPTGEAMTSLQAKYDTADPINVLVSLPEGATFADPVTLAGLADLRDRLGEVEDIAAVASVIPEVNPLTGAPLTPAAVEAAPAPVVAMLLDANPVRDLLLSGDGRHALLMVTTGGDTLAAARDVAEVAPAPGQELTFSGNPVVFSSVLDKLSLFLLVIPPVVIVLLVATFFATIGDLRLSLLALVPAGLGALWTFGLLFALGFRVDIVTVIVPIFVIVMGSADGLHFVTHFQEEAHVADPVERVRSALAHVGLPMILTTISTAAGFLSLVATEVRPIRQLGAFTAIGITFAGLISFFSLPALLSRLGPRPRPRRALLGSAVTRGLQTAVRSRIPAMLLTAAIVVFAAISLPRLAVNPDQLFFFKDDDPVREAFDRTATLFGGATPLIGEFVYDPSGGPDQVARLAGVTEELEALPGIRRVFSVPDLADALPPDQLTAVLAGDVDPPIGRLVSDDGMRFMVLPGSFSTDDLRQWVEFADASPDIRVLTGMPVIWDEVARLVLRAQVISLAVAFVLVAGMLALAYRRLRETLASLVPIALTVATLLGFIAVSGIQLNLLTAVISGIVIGVGIDYAIHFVAAVDYARRDGPGYVLRAIDRAGRPIVANALGIAVALTALWLSPLKIHPQVSTIMWVAMLTAAATALLVIPAFLPRDGVDDQPPGR